MKLFRLENNNILKGIAKDIFPVDNAPVSKGYIYKAAVSLVTPGGVDDYLLEDTDYDCYPFCEAWLTRPDDKTPFKGHLLAFSWKEHRPDKSLGDKSQLITWNKDYALYLCKPRETFIRSIDSSKVLMMTVQGKFAFSTKPYSEIRNLRFKQMTATYVKNTGHVLPNFIS